MFLNSRFWTFMYKQSPKLISSKIRVTEKFCNFHTDITRSLETQTILREIRQMQKICIQKVLRFYALFFNFSVKMNLDWRKIVFQYNFEKQYETRSCSKIPSNQLLRNFFGTLIWRKKFLFFRKNQDHVLVLISRKSLKVKISRCGFFLSLRFYVKSVLTIFKFQNLPFWHDINM